MSACSSVFKIEPISKVADDRSFKHHILNKLSEVSNNEKNKSNYKIDFSVDIFLEVFRYEKNYSYSTVTLLAKFLGWSTLQPLFKAIW